METEPVGHPQAWQRVTPFVLAGIRRVGEANKAQPPPERLESTFECAHGALLTPLQTGTTYLFSTVYNFEKN